MAKKKNSNPVFLMASILILTAFAGSVVVLAAQRYNTVQEINSQADADMAYAELLLQRAAREASAE